MERETKKIVEEELESKICRRCARRFKPVKIGIHICLECMKRLKENK